MQLTMQRRCAMSEPGKKKYPGKKLLKGGLILLLILVVLGTINYNRLVRVYRVINLFEPEVIEDNFRTMGQLLGSRSVTAGDQTFQFNYDRQDLPETYQFDGETRISSVFIERCDTTGLIVARGETILFEEYYRGNTEASKVICWSVSKSILSALFGIAFEEGLIDNLDETVTDYVPALQGSGYEGVRIKDVLQMSSGIRFNEDYADFYSDINRMGRAFAFNTPLDRFVASLEGEREPGTYNQYVSMDTQVLAMILREATAMDLSQYTEEKLWKPLGMEADAYWLVDSTGMEAAFGGFNAVLRDYARFGLLYLYNGWWDGKEVISESWIDSSITPDAPHLMPGENPASDWVIGYGYQWWIPEGDEGDYLAIGIYGQAVYINPRYNIVIARTAVYNDYDLDGEEMELESIEFFRTIARAMGDKR